ncbi:type II toxin-antitoxin system RelE/ParE family toxin [uncultured Acetatifactor sp.]|uniref:type II toxin-antitoxin system RelE/ParE family toxin n=1 Tax=uncultured Acetatifactor sp. TaxID=1671927 RepID=UPI00261D2006|nr:type II toxin-antitoxin system RelE/ParE family toxin [uncultured Acetatifactor sp.]
MVRLEYSQIVRKKLKNLKNELREDYGEERAKKIMGKITKGIRWLEAFPQSGIRVSALYDIECDYSYIFVEHNYFFYRIKDKNTILILEMFHEKEDFMRKLFGIDTTSQETIDYWGELFLFCYH